MAQTILLKRSALQGKVPDTGSLQLGEIAINTYDGKMYLKRSGSVESIQTIITTGAEITGSFNLFGNQSITGSLNVTQGITGSLYGTASFASQALTASYFTTSSVTSASFATSASYALNATNALTASYFVTSSVTSASFATSASYALNSTNALTASYFVTSSVTSASFATSASYALNATNALTSSYFLTGSVTSASYAETASFANNFTVAGTLTAQTINVQTITSSIDYVTGSTIFGSQLSDTHQFTGSVTITGSLAVNDSNVVLSNQTSSMSVLSASFADSASYAVTASYLDNYIPPFPYTGSAEITGSLNIIGLFTQGDGTSVATGNYSYAQGNTTQANGNYSHAEGNNTLAYGSYSHAEGNNTNAEGSYSHAEGNTTYASNQYSHAEGNNTEAGGIGSHAEGESSRALGHTSHAEGFTTTTVGQRSHAEGNSTLTYGNYSHAEGESTWTYGNTSHTEGYTTKTGILYSYNYTNTSEDTFTISNTNPISNLLSEVLVNSIGNNITVYDSTGVSYLNYDVANVIVNPTTTEVTLEPGANLITNNVYIEYFILNSGIYSHAEGENTLTYGSASHAEGSGSISVGDYSHAEGNNSISFGNYSHAEGNITLTNGNYSHAEGNNTITEGDYSHAEGIGTVASGSGQHVGGTYNLHNNTSSLFVIGNGADDNNRSDILRINPSNIEITSSLIVTDGITGSLYGTSSYALTASYADNANIDTGSFATTGSNLFFGDQAIVSGYSLKTNLINNAGSNNRLTIDPDDTFLAYIRLPGFDDGGERIEISNQFTNSAGIYFYTEGGNTFRFYQDQMMFPDNTWQTTAFTGSATSASYALTASYATDANINTSSFATTGSNVFRGDQTVTGSLKTSGSNTLVGNTTLTGSLNVSGSTIQIGNNTLLGNTSLSGSIIISGSENPSTPTIQIFGDTQHTGVVRFNPISRSIDNSISASYIYVSGSTNDLYFTQNGSGYANTTRLRWLEGNLYTGLLNGGLLSTVTGSTTFNLSSGSGVIVNLNASLSENPYPTVQYINWGNFTNQPLTYLTSSIQTFLGIDSSGQIIQQTSPWSDGQYNTSISIGTVLHQNQATTNGSISYPNVAYGWKQRSYDFVKAFGPLKLSGYYLLPSGSATGSLIVSSGTAWADGRNYQTDPNNPSYITDQGTNVSKIFRYYQSGSGFVQNTNGGIGFLGIDPGNYNPNGSGSLTPISPSTPWTNQRVFYYPNSVTKAIVVYYGTAQYATETEAINNLPYEQFVETPNTQQNAIYLGAITIKYNGSLQDSNSFKILPGGIFRNVGGSGGGGSVVTTTLAGLSDVQLSGPTNYQPLVYNATLSKWVNSSNISGSLFGNAQTATSSSYASFATNAATASYFVTSSVTSASFATSASYALNATTAATASYFITSSVTSASFATSASYALNATNALTASYFVTSSVTSASFATSASYALNSTNALTASYFVTSSVTSASFATSASYALNSTNTISASYAATSSYADNFTVNNTLTAQTLVVTTISSSVVYSSGSNIFGNNLSNTQKFTGSVQITGSLLVNGPATINNLTASLFGTASYATTAATASYFITSSVTSASFATSASYALNATNALTASYFVTSSVTSASFATSASYALNATNALTASYFVTSSVTSASFATSSSYAVTASYVANASSFPYTGSAIISGSLTVIGNETLSGSLILFGSNNATPSIKTQNNSLILEGNAGGFSTFGSQLRITANQGAWADNVTASYFQIRTSGSFGTNNYAVFQGGTWGADAPFDRLQFASYYTSFNNGAYGTTPVPTASLESINSNNGAIPLLQLKTIVGQTANYFNITSGSTATAGNVFNVTKDGVVGINTTNTSTESNLFLGPKGTDEGGQLTLQPGTSYASGAMLDNWQDTFRILRGNSTTSNASVASWNLTSRQLNLAAYTGPGSFPGTAAANLAVDSSGNVITVATGTVTSASYASSASFATTASYALTATSASFATNSLTSSYAINATGSFVQGGNSFGDTATLGTNDNQSLVLETNNTTRIFVSSSGNISIGKATPSTPLDISGSTLITGSLTVTQGITGSLFGTASFATTAATASYFVTSSVTSASFATSASYALNATNALTASYFVTSSVTSASFATSASYSATSTSASYAVTSSYADNFTIKSTLTFDGTLTDYSSIASSIVGSNNVFTQSTGSYNSAFYKYTVSNGANARSGEVMAVWNGTSVQYTDVSTVDIGSTSAVTASVSIVSAQAQFNFQTNTSGWSIKSMVTYI